MCDQGRMRSGFIPKDNKQKEEYDSYVLKRSDFQDRLLQTMKECGGCHLHKGLVEFSNYGLPAFCSTTLKKNCSMFSFLESDKKMIKFTVNCACKECIVKANCNKLCDDFLNHYTKIKLELDR